MLNGNYASKTYILYIAEHSEEYKALSTKYKGDRGLYLVSVGYKFFPSEEDILCLTRGE